MNQMRVKSWVLLSKNDINEWFDLNKDRLCIQFFKKMIWGIFYTGLTRAGMKK